MYATVKMCLKKKGLPVCITNYLNDKFLIKDKFSEVLEQIKSLKKIHKFIPYCDKEIICDRNKLYFDLHFGRYDLNRDYIDKILAYGRYLNLIKFFWQKIIFSNLYWS